MKKLFFGLVCIIMTFSISGAQEKEGADKKYKLTSESLDKQGKNLDKQISALTNRIADIIKRYDLINTKGIRFLPYQTTYHLGSDYIEMERHRFIKDEIYRRGIIGIKTKKIKIYTSGQSISKIESEIYEINNVSSETDIVKISDPSPATVGTDDIVFTHKRNGVKLLDNKKLGDVKNTTAFPVRNGLKREFLIPHLTYFKDSLLFIASAYYKSMKDADSAMIEFLKKSTKY